MTLKKIKEEYPYIWWLLWKRHTEQRPNSSFEVWKGIKIEWEVYTVDPVINWGDTLEGHDWWANINYDNNIPKEKLEYAHNLWLHSDECANEILIPQLFN